MLKIDKNRDNSIHVVFGLHDSSGSYIQHPATAVASIFSNTEASVCVHFIHDDSLTDANKEKLVQLTNNFKQHICFHRVDKDFFIHVAYSIASRKEQEKLFSIGKLYRLKIVDFLDGIDKALYLDSDIIVNLDIQEIWKRDIEGYYCAAVVDAEETRENIKNKLAFRKMNLDSDSYFNSGVILLNLFKIRKEMHLFEDATNFMKKQAENRVFVDQDALNFLLQKHTKFLPDKYNFIPVVLKNPKICENKAAIIHFAGPKPWNYRCSPYDWLYWKYFSMTPWGDTVEKLLDAQKDVGIDLGYGVMIGKISSKRRLFNAVKYKILK